MIIILENAVQIEWEPYSASIAYSSQMSDFEWAIEEIHFCVDRFYKNEDFK